jgi:hypothetical protein
LRRAVPSFTVEVRRRARLATTLSPDAQSSETKSPQAGFDRESHRVASAAFEAKKVDPSPVDVAASSPRGRILPSLVPDESLRRPLRESALTTAESEPPSRAPKRPSVQTLKGRDQASKSPRNSGFSSDENAPLAERLSTASRHPSGVQSDDGAGVSPRVATTAPSPVVGDSGGLVPGARQDEAISWRSLATTTGPSLGLTTSDPRERRTLRPRILRGLTIDHLKVESEPSWLATSSAMNSNPASVGSGDCSPRDEAPLHALHLLVDPDPSRREPSRSALTF